MAAGLAAGLGVVIAVDLFVICYEHALECHPSCHGAWGLPSRAVTFAKALAVGPAVVVAPRYFHDMPRHVVAWHGHCRDIYAAAHRFMALPRTTQTMQIPPM